MKKYRLIDNTLGWLVFLVAAITYLLTIEPTASFWDCPEFIAQAFKSEVGHPPGNPIFILVGRFAANFAGGDVMAVSKCVNAMSALLSAATILFLFWTVTHLVKKLVVKDGEEESMTLSQYLVVMGSGVCGALVYTWSDTFWFSAVEAEVYAFSSFCTALVVWLMLKWEDQADDPRSDRWIILIAYVFGFSLGVHLLNLLCIPALALIFYYRKWKETSVKGSLITLLASFGVIVAILYGLEPGFVELGGYFDLFFVNTLGFSYNSGVLFYALLTLAIFSWAIYEIYKGKSELMMRLSFLAAIFISGMLFIGDNLLIPAVLLVALGVYLFKFMKKVHRRIMANVLISSLMIFIGFSCYALIIIRSSANLPLDENSPNTMFGLSSYLSRDQYGKTPLLYGPVYTAGSPQYQSNNEGTASTRFKKGNKQWGRVVKTSPDQPDQYVCTGYAKDPVYPSEMNMLFPRIWSTGHAGYYNTYFDTQNKPFSETLATIIVDENGDPDMRFSQTQQMLPKPSLWNNIEFFLGYQLNYMYMRYFLWNFAGRQNDVQGLNCEMGDVTRGNWITGFNFLDNARLGDQELLPAEYGKENKGHNVFYCLPLLLGIIGLLWQAFAGKRGIEQFWVVFFLFFMTGIAIVLYLNQPPLQPRERDYAYAGSFYAYAIWVGMGVAGLWSMVMSVLNRGKNTKKADANGVVADASDSASSKAVAFVAVLIGLIVPLQMVSQTWDDHDRSYRTAARDFGMNYLSSLDENAIIFTNGDNDTFPLWYLQEVEGYRTDVRVVNLSYLSTDWYIEQMQRAAYKSAPLPMMADSLSYAYGNRSGAMIEQEETAIVSVTDALKKFYSNDADRDEDGIVRGRLEYGNMFIPANVNAAIKAGVISEGMREVAEDQINVPFAEANQGGWVSASGMMVLDLINSSIQQGWKRPVYFACTVSDDMYAAFSPYLQLTGMAYQVTPIRTQNYGDDIMANTDKMYENVTKKFRWGGLDTPEGKAGKIYLDETVRRMVNTTRTMIIQLASCLANEAGAAKEAKKNGEATIFGKNVDEFYTDRITKAERVLALMQDKISEKACAYSFNNRLSMARVYESLYQLTKKDSLRKTAAKLIDDDVMAFCKWSMFINNLSMNYPMLSACNIDNYLARNYVPQLLLFYEQINKDGFEALLKKMAAQGVDVKAMQATMQMMLQQNDQPAPQPAPATAADSTTPEGDDMADSSFALFQ
ncbi:MAG: DUF2723 domain-containing protein [Bacteroidales bacterium]|nr:DUF2723 domain-containing protein [Bacteroidales bacterium]